MKEQRLRMKEDNFGRNKKYKVNPSYQTPGLLKIFEIFFLNNRANKTYIR